MYAKTNPGAGRLPRRQKRVFAVVGVLVVLLLAGLATWGALDSDSYSSSGHGCVNLTVPSSTGGATLHYCGAEGPAVFKTAVASPGPISQRGRPQGGAGR